MASSLWEILVPKFFNDAVEIPLAHHQLWDEFAITISPGMTILRSAKGRWVSGAGLQEEPMIPVLLLCDWNSITQLARFTKEHYAQHSIMFYKVSDEVHFV